MAVVIPDFFEETVSETIERHKLLRNGDRVGVGFSGGADSVALLTALVRLGYECVAMHCNFGLRGDESDMDEEFAAQYAGKLGVKMVAVRFDVPSRRAATGESVEMACRELRYDWFEKQRAELGLDVVALAHHSDDRLETLFINMARKTGLRGLVSMRCRRDFYIRPFLGVSRKQIEGYLESLNVKFRTDSTNNSDDYTRNRVRHHILPAFDSVFGEGVRERINATLDRLEATTQMYEMLLKDRAGKYVTENACIDLKTLVDIEPYPAEMLYELLRLKGLPENETVVANIISSRGIGSGRFGSWVLESGKLYPYESVEELPETIVTPGDWPFAMKIIERESFSPEQGHGKAWFDISFLENNPVFTMRPWREGDRFRPFGMKGSKLISDIYSENKLPERVRKELLILFRNGEAVWIPGVKNSALFPVTSGSQMIVELSQ